MASHGQDSWLDILDAVIFSTNLELPYVRDLGAGSWELGRGTDRLMTWKLCSRSNITNV